jgi:exonuclease III
MIKLAHLNIEKNKHLDLFIPFFLNYKPDILMLQEVYKENLEQIKSELGFKNAIYKEMIIFNKDGAHSQGVAILTNLEVNSEFCVYLGKQENIGHPSFDKADFYLLGLNTIVDNKKVSFATTHFPVTVEGKEEGYQDKIANEFIKKLSLFENLIVTGDFNAPRGGVVFTNISKVLKDNIPKEYKTSLDQNIHRKPGLQYMVDGLFSRGAVEVKNVKLTEGVSDHMAVTAEIY